MPSRRMSIYSLQSTSLSMTPLISRLADAQFRLFAAQVSQAYLSSLNQPPTPARNRSGANNVTEIKTLQSDLDTLVTQYEEATRVLARQRIMDRMSDTLV